MYFVFLCEHRREILERRYTKRLGFERKEENKRREDGQTTWKLYIAADVHTSPEYFHFSWSRNVQYQTRPHIVLS